MAEVKTIIINGVSYTVEDPEAVHYTQQALTDEQKAQARENIGAVGSADYEQDMEDLGNELHHTVKVYEQTLTDAQKVQARKNIGAACIDNTKSGGDAWSAKHTVDTLCPDFSGSGSVVSCDPVEGYPLGVVSHIELVQEGSGDPSPGGVNLISDTSYLDESQWFETSDGLSGYAFDLGDYFASDQYCFSGFAGCGIRLAWMDDLRAEYVLVAAASGEFKEVCQITFDEEAAFKRIALVVLEEDLADNTLADVIGALQSLKLEKGTGSNVRPITGWTEIELSQTNGVDASALYHVRIGQTVYGGSFDWQTGVLTVDRAVKTFTGSEQWNYYISGSNVTSGFSLAISDKAIGFRTSICNCFKNTNNTNAYSNERMEHGLYTDHNANVNVYFDWGEAAKTTATRAAALKNFKAWLKAQYDAGVPVQLCYKLAEPYTIQLTQQEILALSGTNSIYSSTGDTQVSGRADPRAVIRNQQAAMAALIERVAALETAAVVAQEEENV